MKFSRLNPKRSDSSAFADPSSGPVFSVRFLLSLLLIAGGIAWMAYYYIGVRPVAGFGDNDKPLPDPKTFEAGAVTGWDFMGDLQEWNYLIGFGLIMLGLVLAAHRSTPLGRGRGVVVGMLGCFIIGLLWICTYYVVGTGPEDKDVPIFNDLGNSNLIVGIALMAVGFTYATKWE